MKKSMLIIFLFLFSSVVFADSYLVEKPDGSVAIVNYIEGSTKSLERVLSQQGLSGFPISRLQPSDFPPDRTDRNYWKKNDIPIGKKIIIDTVKKQAVLDSEAQKEAERNSVLAKLKISKEEADFLLKK